MPPRSARPYPRSATLTTRAPIRLAMACEPSVLPLSATITSPWIPAARIAVWHFSTHTVSVSASFRQGMTTETSMPSSAASCVVFRKAVAAIALMRTAISVLITSETFLLKPAGEHKCSKAENGFSAELHRPLDCTEKTVPFFAYQRVPSSSAHCLDNCSKPHWQAESHEPANLPSGLQRIN